MFNLLRFLIVSTETIDWCEFAIKIVTVTDIINPLVTMFSANHDSQQEKARASGQKYALGFHAID